MTKVLRGHGLKRYHANPSPDGKYLVIVSNTTDDMVRIAKDDLAAFVAWMEKEDLIPSDDVSGHVELIRKLSELSNENEELKSKLARFAHAE